MCFRALILQHFVASRARATWLVFFVSLVALSSANGQNFYPLTGSCQLPFDPMDSDKMDSSVFSCLRGSINQDALFIPKSPKSALGTDSRLNFQGSLHYGVLHALIYESYHELVDSNNKDEIAFIRKQEFTTIAYQLGNTSIHPFKVLIGQQRPPFGVNLYPEMGFDQIFNPQYFWGVASPGMTVTYDNLHQTRVEISWGKSSPRYAFKKDPQHIVTTRLMYDFSVLGGIRSIFSASINKSGEKKLGVGLLSTGPMENRFHIEWVRIYPTLESSLNQILTGSLFNTANGLESPYQQIVRLAYEDSPQRRARFFILFDDVRFQYRLFTIGLGLNFKPWFATRFLVGFKQDQTEKDKHRWLLGTGIRFSL